MTREEANQIIRTWWASLPPPLTKVSLWEDLHERLTSLLGVPVTFNDWWWDNRDDLCPPYLNNYWEDRRKRKRKRHKRRKR